MKKLLSFIWENVLTFALIVGMFLTMCWLACLAWPEETHQERFHKYMEKNQIEYTDGGCALGWEATK